MNKYIQSVLEFFYDIISIPVFLFHFLGIPFIWAEFTSRFLVFMTAGENVSHGVAILIFILLIVRRIFKAMNWEDRYDMPEWLRWFDQDLRHRILKKIKNKK
ncbi:hypothetical protein IPJ63_03965 [Candidatus Nomurabacteria bacterium]|nr:MAG: hypothetical protein IPJ63_03965 [Candidatus Nomurabacteria bacterium]